MNKILSICIPTMNRADWLLQAIDSILADNTPLEEIEICISNNCSETDYSQVEHRIVSVSSRCKINYKRHDTRLSLDENHHFVKKMSSTDYVYFLGDDDFFLKEQVQKLIWFIKTKNPDLAIFNGYLVDANNTYLGMLCDLPPQEYKTLDDAFVDLKDKCTFGAVLVRKDLLQDDDFLQLYETAHAYGCFWLSIFRKYERKESVKIFIPDFPCVALRCAQKNYNFIDVYYKKIPYWLNTFKRLVTTEMPKQLIIDYEQIIYKKISSLRFLLSLSDSGNDLKLIEKSNPLFYSKHKLKINFSIFISNNVGFKSFKRRYRKYIKKDNVRTSGKDLAEINYYLNTQKKPVLK